MELEIKTTKHSQITWKAKLLHQSSLESKHSFNSSWDVIIEECCSEVNPLNIETSYENLQEGIVNLGTYRVLRQKCRVKDESEDDQRAAIEVQTNLCKKTVKGFALNWIEWNSKINSISNKLMSYGQYHVAPQVFETSIMDRGIIQEQVDHDQVISDGYCSGIRDHDEQDDDEEQEITGVVEKASMLKIVLYLILTVSSLILCFLPRVYGDKIPNLFLPCPWLFYGFNFALMLAAAASLVSIDAKINRCLSDLAILSILTALALFLFSSFIWARFLWDI